MDLKELSVTDRTLVETLAEIAQAESTEHSWSEIEPMLEYCWQKSDHTSALDWEEIAPLIRSACNRTH
ncbi:hypothetical protein [Lysobacter tyrosinilyticus]